MKVYVAQLTGINSMNATPLAAGQVVASARLDPRARAEVDFEIIVGNEPVEALVDELDAPDVVGLSIYMWNEQYSLAVARRIRQRHPECLVVAGGPSIPKDAALAERYLRAHPELSVLVRGEGEVPFRELVRWRLDGAAPDRLEEIASIAYFDAGEVPRATTRRPRLDRFTETASPYLDGTFERLCRRYPGRFPDWMAVALIETNRGCPFRCTFCAAGLIEQNRVYELPVERVFAELEWVADRGFEYLFLADPNFGIRPRDPEIVDYLVDLKARTGFPSYCFYYMTKNARERNLLIVERLRAAGIGCQVALSTQTFDPEVLSAVKRSNIPADRWTRLRDICAEQEIPTYNELILGLPEQTYQSVAQDMARAVTPLVHDTFYLYMCRIIPNTDMDEASYRERYALETRRCRSLAPDPRVVPIVDEYEEIIVGTRTMPVEDWKRAFTLGFLVSASYNQRLLDVVITYLQATLQVDLASYFMFLTEAVREAAEGTVLAELRDVFLRFIDSILGGGSALLPIDGAGPTNREVSDAVVVAALRRYDEFLFETRIATERFLSESAGRPADLQELFRFQRLITPTFGQAGSMRADFEHDWATYWAGPRDHRGPPASATRLRFDPPPYAAAEDFAQFTEVHLATLRAKATTGVLGPFP